MSVRVRYAPSPTGDPHLGIIRTAVFNYLFARGQNGTFMVRLEDTDQKREKEGSDLSILQSLHWLGLDPDEGIVLTPEGSVGQKGEAGPYIQSERLPFYQQYAQQLLDQGKAYRCFCTAERLDEMRLEQQARHQPPRYDRRCRSLSKEESDQRAAQAEPFVIRQAMPSPDYPNGPAMPENGEVRLNDLVRGEVTFKVVELDDQVLLKSDGFPTYQLANVVDDHLMEITHVLRADEWISSAPKNILLYQSFGWEPPLFAHLPAILGPDGKHKLSKREGAEPVLAYRERGYLPGAILNYLAFMGWSPGTEEEFLNRDQLIAKFNLSRVQKSPAVFNAERLEYLNGWYIRQLPLGELVSFMLPFWVGGGILQTKPFTAGQETQPDQYVEIEGARYYPSGQVQHGRTTLAEYIQAVAGVVQERLKHFDETVSLTDFFFHRPDISSELEELVVPKKGSWETTRTVLVDMLKLLQEVNTEEWTVDKLEEKIRLYIQEKGRRNAEVLWPLRATLTGRAASPGSFEMLSVLGKEESLTRLRALVGTV